MRPTVLLGMLLGAMQCAFAQQPAARDVKDLSLEELLDQPVEVTTRNARKARQAPGVVLVLTREEILATGARDLLEVLQLVPGFSFHADVEGVVGVGFRGLWGHEGKVLLLLDGIEQNELLYSTAQLGHHILVHTIERIEVIRGPGSAIYGGTAELAVINVITRAGADLMGVEVAGRYAQTAGGYADFSGAASAGWAFADQKLDVSVGVTGGKGRRTTRTYLDFTGEQTDLRDGSRLDPLSVSVGLKFQGLKARFLYDDYVVGARIGYGIITANPDEALRFRTLAVQAQYDLQLTQTVVLRPLVSIRNSTPWQSVDEASPLFYDKSATRLLGGLALQVDPTPDFSMLLGVESFSDRARLNSDAITGSQTTFAGASAVSYTNTAVYAQALWDTKYVSVTAGGRFEQHSQVGANFAPRIALTGQLDRFNFKLLYSGAFRSPSIENFNLNPAIRAEKVQSGEAELGAAILDVLYASINGFYTNIDSPIAYLYDEEQLSEQYKNADPIASAGAEVRLVLRGRHGFFSASYSLAVPTKTSVYGVEAFPGRTLGFSLHKVTASGKWRIWRGLSAGGSLVFASDRYAFVVPTAALDGTGELGRLGPTALLGVWAGYDGLGLEGLSIQAGAANLLDQNVPFVQPYDSGAAPIPGRGREIFVRLSYALSAR